MATPRNRKHAKARTLEKLGQHPKGTPRQQFPPGRRAWLGTALAHEAATLFFLDESVHTAFAIYDRKERK